MPDRANVERASMLLPRPVNPADQRHFCTEHSHPGAPACTPGVCRSYCGITYHGEPMSYAGPRRAVPADTCPACFDAWDRETARRAA